MASPCSPASFMSSQGRVMLVYLTLLCLPGVQKHRPTAKCFFQLQTLQSENSSLRRQATASACQVQTGSDHKDTASHSSLKRRPSARGSRPMSMYETGSGQKPYLPMGEASHPEESRTRLQPFPTHVSSTAVCPISAVQSDCVFPPGQAGLED